MVSRTVKNIKREYYCGEAMTIEDLENYYDRSNRGRKAHSVSLEKLFSWARSKSDKFYYDEEEGTLHVITKGV